MKLPLPSTPANTLEMEQCVGTTLLHHRGYGRKIPPESSLNETARGFYAALLTSGIKK